MIIRAQIVVSESDKDNLKKRRQSHMWLLGSSESSVLQNLIIFKVR